MAKPGEFCWNELVSSDTESAREFYCALFDWDQEEMPMGETTYTMFKIGNDRIAGMVPSGDNTPGQWLSYIAVEDVEATVNKVNELNGQIHCPVTDVEGMGRFAIISDPSGAVVGVWQSSRQD